MTHKLHI